MHKFHDEGCVVGTALDTSSRHLATGSSSGVVNLYSIAGITRLEDDIIDHLGDILCFTSYHFLQRNFYIGLLCFFGGSYAILLFKKLF